MGWKLNTALGAGFVTGAVILLSVFQNQIRNATFTAGQTVGQAITSPILGIAEPFANLKKQLEQLFPPGIGGTPSATPPLAIAPPSAYAPPYTGPPAGATPPKQDNNNGGGNSGSSSGGSPPLFPGYTGQPDGGLFSPAVPPQPKTPATPPKPTTPATKPATTPTPPTTKAPTIIVNKDTVTDYTKFVNQVMAAIGNFGTQTVNLANQAWKQIQDGKQLVVIPGLPVISVPVTIPAFAEKQKTTKNDISSNDKKTLGMGNAAAKNIVQTPLTVLPGSVWDVSKIKIPQSAPSVSAQSALLKAGLGNLVIGKNSA